MSRRSSLPASGDVPFAWETKPGVSKVAPCAEELPKTAAAVGKATLPRLPPPPCPRGSPVPSGHGLHVPLPPCPFQDAKRISHQYGSGWVDDPFFAAYMECTGSCTDEGKVEYSKQKKRASGMGSRREVFGLSCKDVDRDVVEDGVVRSSRLPSSHLEREQVSQ